MKIQDPIYQMEPFMKDIPKLIFQANWRKTSSKLQTRN